MDNSRNSRVPSLSLILILIFIHLILHTIPFNFRVPRPLRIHVELFVYV